MLTRKLISLKYNINLLVHNSVLFVVTFSSKRDRFVPRRSYTTKVLKITFETILD